MKSHLFLWTLIIGSTVIVGLALLVAHLDEVHKFPRELIELETFTAKEYKKSKDQPRAAIRVFTYRVDNTFSQPFELYLQIENIGDTVIRRDTVISIRDHYLPTLPARNISSPFIQRPTEILRLRHDLDIGEKTNLTRVIITPSKTARIQNLPGAFRLDMYLPPGIRRKDRKYVHLEHNAFKMGTEFFLGEIVNKKPPLDGLWSYNILLFGVVGSGKSTGINTMMTSLSDRFRIIAIAAGKSKHITLGLSKYPVEEHVRGINMITFIDTMGLNSTNYKEGEFSQILDGEVPEGYDIYHNGKFVMKQTEKVEQHSSSNTIPLHEFSKKPHVVLFFVTGSSLKDQMFIPNIEAKFTECTRRGMSPLLVITQVDYASKHVIEKHRQDWLDKLSIAGHQIFFLPAYLGISAEKDFAIDQPAFALLLQALNNAKDSVETQKRRVVLGFFETIAVTLRFKSIIRRLKSLIGT